MANEPRDLWAVAKGPDHAYLLSNGRVAYITYHGCQGTPAVHGPYAADDVPGRWIWFKVPIAYRGPLHVLSREELAARRACGV